MGAGHLSVADFDRVTLLDCHLAARAVARHNRPAPGSDAPPIGSRPR